MTTPPQPPPQGQQPPPQQQGDGLDDAALAVAVAALLAGTAVAGAYAASAAGMLALLKARFRLSSAALQALGSVLSMVTEHPATVPGGNGPASAQVSRMNMARRAQYVIAASKRVLGAVREARAKGESVPGAFADALATERRYYLMHLAAMGNRASAAARTDAAAAKHGKLLGWNAVLDGHTSPECRAADGWNYYASSMPDIGYPGGVHESCRCSPSAPHPGGKLLPGSGLRFARAA
ncbi:MAG TPA: hypothetical protein VK599_13450 [Streptosporangiaceae bacterium]|nr:hypothetical protein [Streptosporangiaceae bacterium]